MLEHYAERKRQDVLKNETLIDKYFLAKYKIFYSCKFKVLEAILNADENTILCLQQ